MWKYTNDIPALLSCPVKVVALVRDSNLIETKIIFLQRTH